MPDNALTLDPQTRDRMVEMKVTCPFLRAPPGNIIALRRSDAGAAVDMRGDRRKRTAQIGSKWYLNFFGGAAMPVAPN